MSSLERFITRRKLARYVFVLTTFPIVAARDELARLRHYRPEMGMDDLRRALAWARAGGTPGPAIPTAAQPATVNPRWARREQDSGPFADIVDPCFDCGDAKADHRDGRCVGDFLHCPCRKWRAGRDDTGSGSYPSSGVGR